MDPRHRCRVYYDGSAVRLRRDSEYRSPAGGERPLRGRLRGPRRFRDIATAMVVDVSSDGGNPVFEVVVVPEFGSEDHHFVLLEGPHGNEVRWRVGNDWSPVPRGESDAAGFVWSVLANCATDALGAGLAGIAPDAATKLEERVDSECRDPAALPQACVSLACELTEALVELCTDHGTGSAPDAQSGHDEPEPMPSPAVGQDWWHSLAWPLRKMADVSPPTGLGGGELPAYLKTLGEYVGRIEEAQNDRKPMPVVASMLLLALALLVEVIDSALERSRELLSKGEGICAVVPDPDRALGANPRNLLDELRELSTRSLDPSWFASGASGAESGRGHPKSPVEGRSNERWQLSARLADLRIAADRAAGGSALRYVADSRNKSLAFLDEVAVVQDMALSVTRNALAEGDSGDMARKDRREPSANALSRAGSEGLPSRADAILGRLGNNASQEEESAPLKCVSDSAEFGQWHRFGEDCECGCGTMRLLEYRLLFQQPKASDTSCMGHLVVQVRIASAPTERGRLRRWLKRQLVTLLGLHPADCAPRGRDLFLTLSSREFGIVDPTRRLERRRDEKGRVHFSVEFRVTQGQAVSHGPEVQFALRFEHDCHPDSATCRFPVRNVCLPSPLEPSVFVSYHRPYECIAADIKSVYENLRYHVSMDSVIPQGVDWQKWIEKAIYECDRFAMLIVPEMVRAWGLQTWVRRELECAVRTAQRKECPLERFIDIYAYYRAPNGGEGARERGPGFPIPKEIADLNLQVNWRKRNDWPRLEALLLSCPDCRGPAERTRREFEEYGYVFTSEMPADLLSLPPLDRLEVDKLVFHVGMPSLRDPERRNCLRQRMMHGIEQAEMRGVPPVRLVQFRAYCGRGTDTRERDEILQDMDDIMQRVGLQAHWYERDDFPEPPVTTPETA